MNLLIGFVLLLCLVGSEFQPAEAASDLWTRMGLVALISAIVPGLAFFQTLLISNRIQDNAIPPDERDTILRRVSICHSAVWLASSLAIVWAVRWQDVVRVNWNLDRWPLLDEAILLAPIVLSLVASWAIFYETQQSLEGRRSQRNLWGDLLQRFQYVSLRFRVYLLIVLIPIGATILARDLNPWMITLPSSVQLLIYGTFCLALAAGFPFLLLFIWKHDVAPDRIQESLKQTCRQYRLRVFTIRVWNTQGRIVNAVLAGMIPWFRIILISDRLVATFPTNEIMAVVRHEAGHLRRWHLPIRIGYMVLPLVALAVLQSAEFGLATRGQFSATIGIAVQSHWIVAIAIYAIYLRIILPWLSHQMEFEADLYSCFSAPPDSKNASLNSTRVLDMSDALIRLASYSPFRFGQSTLFHPSIRERIEALNQIESCPELARQSLNRIAKIRRNGLILLGMFCLIAIAI